MALRHATDELRLRVATAVVVLLLALTSGPPASARRPQGPVDAAPIAFADDLESALAAAKLSGQPIVIVFGAQWCDHCTRFEERTLSAPEVRSLAGDFHWVRADIDEDIALTREHGIEATPTSVVLRPDGTSHAAVVGALDGAAYRAFLESVRQPSAADARDLAGTPPSPATRIPRGYRTRAMCVSQIGYGPLHLPSQAPAQVLRLGLRPRTPSTIAEGQYELLWTESFANIFNYEENDYRLDYLTLNSTLALAYGVSDTFEVELALGNLSRTDSYLDPVTDAFHDLFGLGDSGRDQFPERDNVIDLEPKDGSPDIEDRSSGSEATHVTLTAQHNLTCGTDVWPALAWSVSTRWDAGGDAELEGSSDFSAGLSVSAAKRLGEEVYVYLGAAYNWYGPDESRGLALKDEQWGGLVAFEWAYRPRRSWVLEYLVNEGAAESRDPFDHTTHEVHLGWKAEVRRGTVLEIGLIENIINEDNSPDFGLHFGLRHRF
jgi:hypothetical protein